MQIFVPTHPVEVELAIKPKLEGYFDAEILHPNGSIERPFEKPQKNTVLINYLDRAFNSNFNGGMGNLIIDSQAIAIGTSNAANSSRLQIDSTDPVKNAAALFEQVAWSTNRATSGNSADIDPTTGNAIMTITAVFPPATAPVTIREAASVNTSGSTSAWFGGNFTGTYFTFSRVVLPSPITLAVGDILTMSYTIVIPTLSVTAQTVSLASQNGMDISGQLKLIGSPAKIIGATITAAGARTADGTGHVIPVSATGGLTTATTFPTQLTQTTGMGTNASSASAWGNYTRFSLTRDYTTTWNSAFATTSFRSITLNTSGTHGYQLLLNNQQTKESGKTLSINWRFALS